VGCFKSDKGKSVVTRLHPIKGFVGKEMALGVLLQTVKRQAWKKNRLKNETDWSVSPHGEQKDKNGTTRRGVSKTEVGQKQSSEETHQFETESRINVGEGEGKGKENESRCRITQNE